MSGLGGIHHVSLDVADAQAGRAFSGDLIEFNEPEAPA